MWPLLLNKWVIGALVAAVALLGSYGYGRWEQAGKCRAAQLEAELAAAKRDAAIAQKASQEADAARIAAEQLVTELNDDVAAYEAELAKRPEPACRLGGNDAGRLRNILQGKPSPAP